MLLHLSRVLTGEPFLASDLAEAHLARLRADAEADAALDALFDTFARRAQAPEFDEEDFRRDLTRDPDLGPLVRRIAILWFVGALPKPDWATTSQLERALDYDGNDPRPHFGALMWPAMGAHPPGLSGGYFGYWRYPPES